MTVIEQIGQGRNVSLTTFRRDGRRVATALWIVVDRGELFVLTAPDSEGQADPNRPFAV